MRRLTEGSQGERGMFSHDEVEVEVQVQVEVEVQG